VQRVPWKSLAGGSHSEVLRHQAAADGRGPIRPRSTALDEDGDGDDRYPALLRGREADEPRVRGLLAAELRRSGLARRAGVADAVQRDVGLAGVCAAELAVHRVDHCRTRLLRCLGADDPRPAAGGEALEDLVAGCPILAVAADVAHDIGM